MLIYGYSGCIHHKTESLYSCNFVDTQHQVPILILSVVTTYEQVPFTCVHIPIYIITKTLDLLVKSSPSLQKIYIITKTLDLLVKSSPSLQKIYIITKTLDLLVKSSPSLQKIYGLGKPLQNICVTNDHGYSQSGPFLIHDLQPGS